MGQRGPLGTQCAALGGQLVVAGGDLAGESLQLGHLDHHCLEQIDQPALLRDGVVDLAVQPGELDAEEFVVWDRLGERLAAQSG